MQKFYIYQDEIQQGPFSVDELRQKNISQHTLVWFEGQENWVEAIEVSELNEVFESVPPPFVPNSDVVAVLPKQAEITIIPRLDTKANNKNKTLIFVVIGFVIVCGLGFVYSNHTTTQRALEIQIEVERQVEKQVEAQRQAEIQQREAAKQAEIERKKRAAKAARRRAKLRALNQEYDQAVLNWSEARTKLEQIQSFHLLRTRSEKEAQVNEQVSEIMYWEREVARIQTEIGSY